MVAAKRKRLDDVQQDLKAAQDKAKPIFELLNLKPVSRPATQALVASMNALPVPLFILYHQSLALKEAFDTNLEVAIEGESFSLIDTHCGAADVQAVKALTLLHLNYNATKATLLLM